MKAHDFPELYNIWLLDIKSLEEQLVEALPKVAEKVTNPKLRNAILEHKKQTDQHLLRATNLLEQLGMETNGPKCPAMAGLIKETNEIMGEIEPGDLLDAAIIGACQKVEHYEIATYGTACTFAKQLGRDDDFETLNATLGEEYSADHLLTDIATSGVNSRATAISGE